MFNRKVKMYDEPHTPELLTKLTKNKNLNKGKFLNEAHFFSYYLQMKKIYDLKVKSVCEIGPGENFIQKYMKSLDIKYDTMDIFKESNPTYLSTLEDFDISTIDNKYEMVAAFQMLEHSNYDNFKANLQKMKNMSSKYIYISLPYSCNKFSFSFNIQLGQNKRFKKSLELIWPTNKANRKYRKEYMIQFPWAIHYFEIGRKGFPKNKVLDDIQSVGLTILETFHSQNSYHYFILAEKQ